MPREKKMTTTTRNVLIYLMTEVGSENLLFLFFLFLFASFLVILLLAKIEWRVLVFNHLDKIINQKIMLIIHFKTSSPISSRFKTCAGDFFSRQIEYTQFSICRWSGGMALISLLKYFDHH